MERNFMKIKIKTKISLEELGVIAYSIFLIATLLSTTFYFQYIKGVIYNSLLLLSLGLMTIREALITKYTRRTIYGLLVCVLFGGLIWMADMPNRNILILTVFFVYFSRNISFEKIANISMKISIAFLLFIVLSSWTGFITNYITYSGGRSRKYLGFLYALFPSTIMFNITALNIYLKKASITWKNIILLLIANCFVFYQTNSRLSFLLSIILICFSVLLKCVPNLKKKWKAVFWGLTFGFPFFALVSIMCMFLYQKGSRIIILFDLAMERRIHLASDTLAKYGISLFGTKFSMVGNGLDIYGNNTSHLYSTYSYIDNWYDQILIRDGWLFCVVVICVITVVSVKVYFSDKDGYLTIILFMLSVQSLIQDSIMSVYFNSFIFVIGFYLMNEFNKIKNNRQKEIIFRRNNRY